MTGVQTCALPICCRSLNTGFEPWEGISDNSLRVIISEFFPLEENLTADDIHNQIKERLNQRASLIIASYISINLPRNKISNETDNTFNKLINEIITDGKQIKYDCSESNYCTGSSEYNIKDLHSFLESLNKQ